jgi:uncharacterized protein YidB (DUF937 family)
MDMNNLLKTAALAFINSKKSGDAASGLNVNTIVNALSNLIGKNAQGELDIAGLLANMQGGGLAQIASSFLSSGENEEMSLSHVLNLFGSDKINHFASELGLSESEAVGGLSDAVPQLIDQASSGGSLLDSVGGLGGAMGLAGKLFG